MSADGTHKTLYVLCGEELKEETVKKRKHTCLQILSSAVERTNKNDSRPAHDISATYTHKSREVFIIIIHAFNVYAHHTPDPAIDSMTHVL